MQPSRNIIELRQLLAEKIPGLSQSVAAEPVAKVWPTGIGRLDGMLDGGLPQTAITEIVTPASRSGSSVFIGLLLEHICQTNQWMALIDGQDSFDPTPFSNETLSRLLWIRCHRADEAVKSADLLLRDRNLPLVILDLAFNPAAQVRKISSSVWYRLQRLVEQSSTAVLVFSPEPIVSSAQTRLALPAQWSLDALEQDRQSIMHVLKIRMLESREGSDAANFASDGG